MKHYRNYDLSQISYYQTGGFCQEIFFPETIQEVSEALQVIKGPLFILGLGSNSLVLDDTWQGSVLCLKDLKTIERVASSSLSVEAGAINSEVAEFALRESLGGIAWMYGLPGFVGATVRMNARCYGGEISQVVTEIIAVDRLGVIKFYKNSPQSKDVFQGYKKTIFMSNQEIVVAVIMDLKEAGSSDIKNKMITCYQDRVSKGQYLKPSCGCVFKNNYKPEVSVPSGLLIDYCNLRGTKLRGAQVSLQHANFINNEESASSKDILELSFLIREKVWEETGVWLEYEMEVLGELCPVLRERFFEQRKPQYNFPVLKKLRETFQERK